MNISKFKVVLKYLTGGLASVVEYLLEQFNGLIAKLPAEDVARYAQLAKDIANFLANLCDLISSEPKRNAAKLTADAFADLAAALIDSKITSEELDTIIDAVKAAVAAWKDAK